MIIPIRYFALVALLVAVPISAWAIAFRPLNNAVQETAGEIRTRTHRMVNYSVINDQYREMKTMINIIERATNETISRIPTNPDAEQWLHSASEAAESIGLFVRSVTTSGAREEGEYNILPVDLNVSGNFSDVYLLLQRFEQMNRLSRVERMTIHRVDDEVVDARLIIHLIFGAGGDE